MRNDSIDPIKYFTDAISKDKKHLTAQLKEVEEKYPLVALAYQIQRAVIYQLSAPINSVDANLNQIIQAVNPFNSESSTQLQVEQRERLQKLKTCLIRAHTSSSSSGEQYQAGVACFNAYVEG